MQHPDRIRLEIGPFDVTGDYRATLRLPLGERCFEEVPVRVEVYSRYALSPRRLVLSLQPGTTRTVDLRMQGPPGAPILPILDATQVQDGITFSLGDEAGTVLPEASRRMVTRLTIRVDGKSAVYDGRLLVRPLPGADYAIPLDYVVSAREEGHQ
ncbi:MAG: hypothetical protein ACE5F1_17135 [Planctomycetota bacterium]